MPRALCIIIALITQEWVAQLIFLRSHQALKETKALVELKAIKARQERGTKVIKGLRQPQETKAIKALGDQVALKATKARQERATKAIKVQRELEERGVLRVIRVRRVRSH